MFQRFKKKHKPETKARVVGDIPAIGLGDALIINGEKFFVKSYSTNGERGEITLITDFPKSFWI